MSGFLIVKVLRQGDKHEVELFQGTYEQAIEKAKDTLSDEVVKALLFEEIAEIENAPVVKSIKAVSSMPEKAQDKAKSTSAITSDSSQMSPPKAKLVPELLKDNFFDGSAIVRCGCGTQFSYSTSTVNCPSCGQLFPIEQAKQRRYGLV